MQTAYPLSVGVCRLSLCINKTSVHSCFVDPIKLFLEPKEIRLSKSPGLRYRQPVQLVPNVEQLLVLIVECFIDFSIPVEAKSAIACFNSYVRQSRGIPLQHHVCPLPASFEQFLDVILARKRLSIVVHEIPILHFRLGILQVLLKISHFGCGKLDTYE